ncbi:MAG: DUF1289 domain-containing protein [Gammaproteobacteria bacterium]|nr:DUF1289 domain-containing protein [Gammaproteobacteria bacterium]
MSQSPAKEEVVLSPCVGVCALDDDDVCIGCWRSGEEISRWGYLDNAGKRAILKKVEERLKNN